MALRELPESFGGIGGSKRRQPMCIEVDLIDLQCALVGDNPALGDGQFTFIADLAILPNHNPEGENAVSLGIQAAGLGINH